MHHLPSIRLGEQELDKFENKYKDFTAEILRGKPTKIDQHKDAKGKRLEKSSLQGTYQWNPSSMLSNVSNCKVEQIT